MVVVWVEAVGVEKEVRVVEVWVAEVWVGAVDVENWVVEVAWTAVAALALHSRESRPACTCESCGSVCEQRKSSKGRYKQRHGFRSPSTHLPSRWSHTRAKGVPSSLVLVM